MVMGMVKDCDNCIYLGRPSYDYPCTVCESAYGSDPSKWEGVVAATADMVEVVRCKDCKHWLKDVPGCTEFVGRCKWANYMVGATGYCVYGERKDNG